LFSRIHISKSNDRFVKVDCASSYCIQVRVALLAPDFGESEGKRLGRRPAGAHKQVEARHQFVESSLVAEHIAMVGQVLLHYAHDQVGAHRLEGVAELRGGHDRFDNQPKGAGWVSCDEVLERLDEMVSRVHHSAFGQAIKNGCKLPVEPWVERSLWSPPLAK
jgi:hypothetical protein